MAPILQRLVALAVCVLLGFLLLGEMTFAIRCHSSHMRNVVLVVLAWILLWILFQYLHDLAATTDISTEATSKSSTWSPLMPKGLSRAIALRPSGCLRLFAFQPFLQLVRCHVDKSVEVTACVLSLMRECRVIANTYSITSLSGLTIVADAQTVSQFRRSGTHREAYRA